tara:strand:+ start:114 stop:950 length:837 start_codon:yes stop_codon:yes gene_type:complete
MGRYITLLLFISVAFPQFSIEGKRIHNHEINEYYSDDEFINRLNSDPNFVNDENFLSYKKYVNRLKSKGSKCIYCFSFMSIAAGFDGINNPDDFQDEDNPPGLENIAFGILLPLSYHTYNSDKKRKTLYNVIQRHNDIYSKDEIIDFSPPDRWDSSVSYGFLSEKIPVSGIEYSVLYNVNKHSEFYVAIGSMLFASGVGLGFKYYFKNKSTPSIFISFGSHLSHLGTAQEGMTIYGLSISPGKKMEYNGKLYNLGISFMLMGDNSFGAIPFINLERRF